MYWSHLAELNFHVYALRSLDGEPLRNNILILNINLEFIRTLLLNHSEIGFSGADLNRNIFTRMSLCSLSFRSACTIIVLLSNSLLLSFPLSRVFINRVCGPSLRISTILLAEEVSLQCIELIFTFLSRGASVTRYF